MQPMTAGITKANTGIDGIVWNILGQTYVPKQICENSFSCRHPVRDRRVGLSTLLLGKSVHRVARVTALVRPAHIGDQRLRVLHFHFKRSDQAILRVHRDMVAFSLELVTDRKLHWRSP